MSVEGKTDSPFEFITVDDIAKTIHSVLQTEFEALHKEHSSHSITAYLTLETETSSKMTKASRSIKLCIQRFP